MSDAGEGGDSSGIPPESLSLTGRTLSNGRVIGWIARKPACAKDEDANNGAARQATRGEQGEPVFNSGVKTGKTG